MISETWNFLKTHELHKCTIPSADYGTTEWISCGYIAMKKKAQSNHKEGDDKSHIGGVKM